MIRVVWGTGTGPTDVAAYDAALAEAGVHNYNLVTVSSIVPAGESVTAAGTAPDLGPAGNRLTAVEAHATTAGPGRVTAGLGWATGPGPGLLYEAAGESDEAVVARRIREGLAAGRDLRGWTFEDEGVRTTSTEVEEGYASAVVLAAFGESTPIV